jgi:RimJ/RimL family protein N-acetyltransferase
MNTHSASLLKKKDADKLKNLASACGMEAWGHASIDFSDDHIFVCEKDGTIVAAANFKHKSPSTVAIGIATHPEHRGKGYGKSAVSAAIQSAHELGYLVTYQTLETNLSSIAVANSLGFKQFGQSMAVRFK